MPSSPIHFPTPPEHAATVRSIQQQAAASEQQAAALPAPVIQLHPEPGREPPSWSRAVLTLVPLVDPEPAPVDPPSVFSAFASAVDQLAGEAGAADEGGGDLRDLCFLLDRVLTTTAGLMPVPARQRTLDAKRRADAALRHLRARSVRPAGATRP